LYVRSSSGLDRRKTLYGVSGVRCLVTSIHSMGSAS
jgi:hypothetical protein